MIKKAAILSLVCLSFAAIGAEPGAGVLRDGLVVSGIDGKLIKADSNDVLLSDAAGLNKKDGWFFKADAEIKDDKASVKAGERIQLLPTSALEKMTADMLNNPQGNYRIWGKVTRYRDKNFIFTTFFLPVVQQSESAKKPSLEAQTEIMINDPNDDLSIPQEVVEKLRNRKVIKSVRTPKGLEVKEDTVLSNRIGYIIRKSDGRIVFVTDAFGRNVPKTLIHILPSEALELTQTTQTREPELIRFKVSGLMTKYKEQQYLLLQRATRIYSYGNFDK